MLRQADWVRTHEHMHVGKTTSQRNEPVKYRTGMRTRANTLVGKICSVARHSRQDKQQ